MINNNIATCSSTGSIHNELSASEGFPVVCADCISAEHHGCKTSEYRWFEKVRSHDWTTLVIQNSDFE